MKVKAPLFDGTQPCREHDWRLFFTDASEKQNRKLVEFAQRVCDECPFKMPCFEWAMDHYEWGIWGGTTRKKRAFERHRRAKAAGVT